MDYCNPNETFLTVWYEGGLSSCFWVTGVSVFLLLYMITLFIYQKLTAATDKSGKPNCRLLHIQIFLHYVRICAPILSLILHYWNWIGQLYGHLLLKYMTEMTVWTISLTLINMECDYHKRIQKSQRYSIAIILFWAMEFVLENLSLINDCPSLWNLFDKENGIKFGVKIERYFCLLAIFISGINAPGLSALGQQSPDLRTDDSKPEDTAKKSPSLRNCFENFRKLLPRLWPKSSFHLQLCILAYALLFIADRFVNFYLPLYNKWIIDSLTTLDVESQKLLYRWDFLLISVLLRLAQNGLLNKVQNYLWLHVELFLDREMQVYVYQHLHRLSLRWHLSRKTGEILKVMDRGAASVKSILNNIVRDIGPTVIDLVTAMVFFAYYFNLWLGVIVIITMSAYITVSVYLADWSKKHRKTWNKLDDDFESKAVDALLNFETVKYYNAEEYEVDRYRASLLKRQETRKTARSTGAAFSFAQSSLTTIGTSVGSMLCAWYVVQNWSGFTVGTYVLFGSYVNRLYGPVYWLTNSYKELQESIVDMEKMFDILNQEEEVKDEPDAPELNFIEGRIEFKNVNFHYEPENPILKNVSFVVEPGKTVALVGPSGSGKSTIIRLIFRFYDAISGSILIDNQDISKVTQKSLRQRIGVVPQDTVLFNDTINYNIKYGKITATDDELFAASQAAEIHDKILSFTDGYAAKVGERGLKLSGGEKQRVAIARTILKAPNFVLLDEATSALDTETERLIQASLDEVCIGRTTLVVAHRLSTIVDADEILVLKNGEIMEHGSHDDLMNKNGLYANMWKQQLEKPISRSSSSNSLQLRKQAATKSTTSSLANFSSN